MAGMVMVLLEWKLLTQLTFFDTLLRPVLLVALSLGFGTEVSLLRMRMRMTQPHI